MVKTKIKWFDVVDNKDLPCAGTPVIIANWQHFDHKVGEVCVVDSEKLVKVPHFDSSSINGTSYTYYSFTEDGDSYYSFTHWTKIPRFHKHEKCEEETEQS